MHDPVKANDPAKVAELSALFSQVPMVDLIMDAVADMGAIDIAGQAFPYSTSNPTTTPNCYLCSPQTAYVNYAIEETHTLDLPRPVQRLMQAAIKAFKPLLHATGLDAQIQLNNWMVSTNPVPDLDAELADAIKETCIARHPDRAIVIRSLNDVSDAGSIDALSDAGFTMLAARQIYFLPKTSVGVTRDVRRDAKILAETELDIVEGSSLTREEYDRCIDLYGMLYLDKYTALNPHYTATFLREMQDRGLMRIIALRHPDAGIVGFTGLFESLGTLTQPLVGYDTRRAQNEGLYRMLMQIGREHAQSHGLHYNMSAGAAGFKRNRGGVSAIEYTAVYVAHLSRKNRVATAWLSFLTRKIGIPLVKRIET
jgi:hypothetical protein